MFANLVLNKKTHSMQNMYPKEIVETTIHGHHFKHQTKSKIIYIMLIVSSLGIGFASPYIFIDIYSSANGILRPNKETNPVSSLYSGRIKKTFILENSHVEKGDTLIILDDSSVKESLKLANFQLDISKSYIRDLKHLTNNDFIGLDSIFTIKYKYQYDQFAQKLNELKIHHAKVKKDYNRQKILFEKEVISKADFENYEYELEIIWNNLIHFKERERNSWQVDLDQQVEISNELESSIKQYKTEFKNLFITASINGTLQNSGGLEAGNFINSGKYIAEISPNTELIVECYLDPSDIGFIKEKNTVKFQVHAFNHNEWGMATGEIISIQNDVSIINNLPKFKVKCSIDQDFLQLKNGFIGKLKKGMTISAYFYLIERSVYDLLFDKIEDWFPSKNFNN